MRRAKEKEMLGSSEILRKGETQTWQLFLSHITPILLPQNSWKSQATAVRMNPWGSEEITTVVGRNEATGF